MLRIAPSLLSANFAYLSQEIALMQESGADWLHYDVMDGQFVPNLSFGPKILSDVRKVNSLLLDVHLMVFEPFHLLEPFARAGADRLTIHVEACDDPLRYFEKMNELGVKPGITLRPGTPLKEVEPYLPHVDLVLVMSVEPGYGGQDFLPESLERIASLKAFRENNRFDYLIEVDGGINTKTAPLVKEAGADVLVAGSALFGKPNPRELMEQMRG